MQKKILFVDDEPNILQGLKRLLHGMRDEWEMTFVGNADEALAVLQNGPQDVVISDMRMPGMNGGELLEWVKNKYPSSVRIILSGEADREAIIRMIGPVHQFLSKPCDAEELKNMVTRACKLRDHLKDEKLEALISRIGSLPSLPAVYSEIMKELRSANCSIDQVGKIIAKDIGMTAKVLQLVNSAFFGLPQHIATPTQAATMLGLDIIKALVLTLDLFSSFDDEHLKCLQSNKLWTHSLNTAAIAKEIAKLEGLPRKTADDTYLAGLLHDVGKLILASNMPEKYFQVNALIKDRGKSTSEAEKMVFGTSHATVGGYLMGLWGLPDQIVEAISFHNQPDVCEWKGFSPLTAVHAADHLELEFREPGTSTDLSFDSEYLKTVKVADKFDFWREKCRDIVKEG